MGSANNQKAMLADYIAELLIQNQFIAFTRTPRLGGKVKKLRTANRVAMDRLTIQTKAKTYV
jgi:hypothetical protein